MRKKSIKTLPYKWDNISFDRKYNLESKTWYIFEMGFKININRVKSEEEFRFLFNALNPTILMVT